MDNPQTVCVQGLGFVGAAMAVATARSGHFRVIGVERDSEDGRKRADALAAGRFPFPVSDEALKQAARETVKAGRLETTTDASRFSEADIVLVSVGLDLDKSGPRPGFDQKPFVAAIETIGASVPEHALIIIETTVPPGTTETIAAPVLKAQFTRRGLNPDNLLLANSYERVMPGPDYLQSISRYWRVYAGFTEKAADTCEAFLSKIIDVNTFPLTRLKSCTASETAKVLENTYRATTIALMDEWGQLAEQLGIDLFEVIDAIRIRPTHSNIRQPGFGVGGYCLTKDPLFAPAASAKMPGPGPVSFPMSELAVSINDAMPVRYGDWLADMLGGIDQKRVLLCGVSYRSGVGDTRFSASEILARRIISDGGTIICHDPEVAGTWQEMNLPILKTLPAAADLDAVVFAVDHDEYGDLNLVEWLGANRPVIVDANNILNEVQIKALQDGGLMFRVAGRGDIGSFQR